MGEYPMEGDPFEPSYELIRYTLPAFVTHDPVANAATVQFSADLSERLIDRSERLIDCPLTDFNGEVAAVISFFKTGELAQIELLDAAVQLPPEQPPEADTSTEET